ncbi:MAG: ABC-type nitrate/sulfonate/bicarbonate transport system, ATPase component [Clostridiales bacterium]|nr:ABC-type nitrate/sulfonate/bicarbonate transport system, ATPase component [Clostridiales bacterium]
MIEIRNLSVRYKNNSGYISALDDITLSICPGDILAVVGPSGCGKSSMLHVLAGILKNYDGAVTINNSPINPEFHRIGFIPQNFGLLPWKNVYSNAVLGLEIKKIPIKEQSDLIDHVFSRLGLNDLKERYPNQLSGGQRQRVAIARSLLLKPDILLMDEPFSALDALSREDAQDLFLELWEEYKVSTLLVTHSIEEAVYIGNKILVMSKSPGKIVYTLDNPLFGKNQRRLDSQFYQFCMDIRRLVNEEWTK